MLTFFVRHFSFASFNKGLKTFLMKYVDESALQRRQSHTEDDHPPSPMAVGGGDGSDQQQPQSSGGLRFHAPQTPPSNPMTPASPHQQPQQQQQGQFLQSPPSSVRQPSPQQPSPAGGGGPGFTAPSPANPMGSVGSPFPSVQSPAGIGSPRPSPRQTSGPSPAPRPQARLLPQRLWAGANPTPLTAQAFDEICRPSLPRSDQMSSAAGAPQVAASAQCLAPVHRFLGALFLRKTLLVKKCNNL